MPDTRILTHNAQSTYPYTQVYGETVVPVYQNTAFSYATAQQMSEVFAGRQPGYNYSRIANPTYSQLEQNLAILEDGLGCIATASGMAAITAVAVGLLQSGDHIVSANGIFAGTISLFEQTLGRLGIQTTFVDASHTKSIADAIRPNTRMIFLETIGNPKLDIPDIPAIATIARSSGIPLVVDNTVMPGLVRPKVLGADIVVYSTSKFICGYGTAIGGAIIDTGNFDWAKGPFEHIRSFAEKLGSLAFLGYLRNLVCRNLGACPAPWNCFLINQGLQTLSLRMAQHAQNASRVAAFLISQKPIRKVRYPGLATDPYYNRARRLFGGKAGAIITVFLGDRQRAFAFIDGLKLIKQAPNIGDAKTLVIHPASTIFLQIDQQRQLQMGVTEDMVRISVGLEDCEDIKEDIEQSLHKLESAV